MPVFALAGSSGSPGVTTSAVALLLSWPLAQGRRMVLAECDPDGGAVLYGMLQGALGDRYGMRNLSVAARHGNLEEAFWRQLVDLTDDGQHDEPPQNRLLLPGFTDPAQAAGMAPAWEQLAGLFTRIERERHDVLVDLGRRGAFGPGNVLAQRADLLLVVARSTMRGVQAAQSRLEALRGQFGELGVLLVDEGPYSASEVERALHAPVVVTLPFRPQLARVLSDGAEEPRQFTRSDLMRAAHVASTPMLQRAAMRRSRLAAPPSQPARPPVAAVGAGWEVSGDAR
ncbi:hypothetical protein [Streptomyces chattanoogensis]|uniref:hypothetical protein n=1 Tax=Streptomyces chattanoogensis TaxID=66876 RepID=UPI0036783983